MPTHIILATLIQEKIDFNIGKIDFKKVHLILNNYILIVENLTLNLKKIISEQSTLISWTSQL